MIAIDNELVEAHLRPTGGITPGMDSEPVSLALCAAR
jgi:hypothetical protein